MSSWRVYKTSAPRRFCDQFSQPVHDIQHQVFFHQTLASHRSQVPAAVSGIEHQAKLRHSHAQLSIEFVRRRGPGRWEQAEAVALSHCCSFSASQRLRYAPRTRLSDFHDQPVRIRLQADREIGSARSFEHHPAYAFSWVERRELEPDAHLRFQSSCRTCREPVKYREDRSRFVLENPDGEPRTALRPAYR